MREVRYQQRNIVYLETAMNGVRFWRNLTSCKSPFTLGQKLFFGMLLFALVSPSAVLLVIMVATLRSDLPAWNLHATLSTTAFIWVLYAFTLFRALSAVFAGFTLCDCAGAVNVTVTA